MTCAGGREIKSHSYYAWTKEFMEAGKERLARDSMRDATRGGGPHLKRENGHNVSSAVSYVLDGKCMMTAKAG